MDCGEEDLHQNGLSIDLTKSTPAYAIVMGSIVEKVLVTVDFCVGVGIYSTEQVCCVICEFFFRQTRFPRYDSEK